MKKYMFLVLMMLMSTFTFAQFLQNLIPIKGEGLLVTTSGDTIQGTMRVFVENIYAIKEVWHLKSKKEKTEYPATKVTYLQFLAQGDISGVFFQKKIPSVEDTLLLKPVATGAVNLYPFIEHVSMPGHFGANGAMTFGGSAAVEVYILEKNGKWAENIRLHNYKVKLKGILQECPELTEKIGTRGYKLRHLKTIIAEYNYCVKL